MEILFHPIADAEYSEAYEWYENIEKKLSQII